MTNILFSILFAIMGCAFGCVGVLLILNRIHKLTAPNASYEAFQRFYYWVGVVLGAADAILGLTALVTAVLILIYPVC